jgi:hypothetical protein
VCFEQDHCSFNASVKPTATISNNNNNYGTFYVWTQRLGYIPSHQHTLQEAITQGDCVVFINPTQRFTQADVTTITTYLQQGGKILLIDSITNSKSTANDLLSTFGIWVTTTTDEQPLYQNTTPINNTTKQGTITTPYLTLTGGTPILTNEKNTTYATMIEFNNTSTGKTGRLVVLVDSYSFSDALMGGLFSEPTPTQKDIYDTEFFLFQDVIFKDI